MAMLDLEPVRRAHTRLVHRSAIFEHDSLATLLADPQRPEMWRIVGDWHDGDVRRLQHSADVLQALPPIRPWLPHHVLAIQREHVECDEARRSVTPVPRIQNRLNPV